MKHKILILSGKGGVGKSTVTALFSRALAASNSERNVSDSPCCSGFFVLSRVQKSSFLFPVHCFVWLLTGQTRFTSLYQAVPRLFNPNTLSINTLQVAVLDIDICGPSQPRVLGVADEQVHQSGSGWSPVVSMSLNTSSP